MVEVQGLTPSFPRPTSRCSGLSAAFTLSSIRTSLDVDVAAANQRWPHEINAVQQLSWSAAHRKKGSYLTIIGVQRLYGGLCYAVACFSFVSLLECCREWSRS